MRVALRLILAAIVFFVLTPNGICSELVHSHGIAICSTIISELSEGKIGYNAATSISTAIANAGNKHFGRVTCGDMWLYLAIAHVESGFRSNVINEYSCCGIFQVHAPSWAGKFGVSTKQLLNPSVNADCGIRIFKYYLELYKDVIPALSAYNSDHPRASLSYAQAVLSTRRKIKQRYTELYRILNSERVALGSVPTAN
jgi:hypothetical protein